LKATVEGQLIAMGGVTKPRIEVLFAGTHSMEYEASEEMLGGIVANLLYERVRVTVEPVWRDNRYETRVVGIELAHLEEPPPIPLFDAGSISAEINSTAVSQSSAIRADKEQTCD
jgi:hypothetical protein